MQVIWSSTFYSMKYFFSLTKAVLLFLDHMTFIVITLPVLQRWGWYNFHLVMRQWLFHKNKSANTVMDLQLRAHPVFQFSSGSLCISSERFNKPLTFSPSPLTFWSFWVNMCSTLAMWYLNPTPQCSYTTILLSPGYTWLPLLSERCHVCIKTSSYKATTVLRASHCWIYHLVRELSAPQALLGK